MGRASYSRLDALMVYLPKSVAEDFLHYLEVERELVDSTVKAYAACIIRILEGLDTMKLWDWYSNEGYKVFE